MNIKLGPKLERYVSRKVKSGEYLSQSEVIRDALRLLEEKDQIRQIKLETLRKEIELGYRAVEEGRVQTFNEESLPGLLESIQRAGKAKLESTAKRAG